MSKDDRELIAELRGLLAKATPLPWVPNHEQPGAYARIETEAHGYFNDGWVIASELLGPDADDNIALIAKGINALPTLLTRLEALQAQPVGEVVEACRQRAIVLFQAFARGVRKFPDEEATYVNDVETFVTAIDDAYAPLAALTASPPVVEREAGGLTLSEWDRMSVDERRAFYQRPFLYYEQREAIARIIDPEAWKLIDYWGDMASRSDLVFRVRAKAAPSLAKADAILALTPVEEVGWQAEAERQEGLAKVYRRAQLTAEEKLCREEANARGWQKRAERLEQKLATLSPPP